jgi:hypothetical protein
MAVRTLIAGGFSITSSERHPGHIEIECRRADLFGVEIEYVIAVFDQDAPSAAEKEHVVAAAKRSGRVPVVVAGLPGPDWFGWADVLASLGGAVPNWTALGPSYNDIILTTSTNKLPTGMEGEAWQIFEEAVADGFEYLLGARVLRLGGKRRSKKVSDLVTLMPDQRILVIDTKAYSNPFDTSSGHLRALEEYTKKQIERQRGQFSVAGAVLVAAEFSQDSSGLHRTSADFLANTGLPATFVEARTIASTVARLSKEPTLRAALQWRMLFCRGGLLEQKVAMKEIDDASVERKAR